VAFLDLAVLKGTYARASFSPDLGRHRYALLRSPDADKAKPASFVAVTLMPTDTLTALAGAHHEVRSWLRRAA
jgi:hypothetical protein